MTKGIGESSRFGSGTGVIVGVDVGGTFTDCIIFDPTTRQVRIAKVRSTPSNQSDGLINAVSAAWGQDEWAFDALIHGTTVATNAVLERRGDSVALLTTMGYRDVLEMRRRDRPHLYGLRGEYRPLVPRALAFEVAERVDSSGMLASTVDLYALSRIAGRLASANVASVVVSFVNSYANPANELEAVGYLRDRLKSTTVVAASDISREYREFERTSTAVVSAYVQPRIAHYLGSVAARARDLGYLSDVWIVQSNGGRMSLDIASEQSVKTILSGPAAGVVAGQRIAERAGFRNAVTMDMGGTSLDVGVIVNAQVATTPQAELEFGIPLRLPMVDVHTVGAGGGSIAWIDGEGLLTIGPRSAGAVPGPACYGLGGLEPTVTDANVVLGRIGEGESLGSDAPFVINRELAIQAVFTLSPAVPGSAEDIARAVVDVAVRKISDAVRLVTVERGLDPADLTLVAFGGAGPVHVCDVMREVGLNGAVVPRFPGLTSALGCIMGDVRHDFVQTIGAPLSSLPMSRLKEIIQGHVDSAGALLIRENVDPNASVVSVEADMNYDRQTHTVSVPLIRGDLSVESIRAAFERTYVQRFGRSLTEAGIILVNIRTSVLAARPQVTFAGTEIVVGGAREEALQNHGRQRTRRVLGHGQAQEWPIVMRNTLAPGQRVVGPAIIQQSDATCVLDPAVTATVDAELNLVLTHDG